MSSIDFLSIVKVEMLKGMGMFMWASGIYMCVHLHIMYVEARGQLWVPRKPPCPLRQDPPLAWYSWSS